MHQAIAGLLARAFHRGAARDANRLLDEGRTRMTLLHGAGEGYELVLDPAGGPGQLARAAPALAYHLRCKGLRVRSCPGLFVALFVGDVLALVEAADYFEQLREVEGWSREQLGARASRWEEGEGRG